MCVEECGWDWICRNLCNFFSSNRVWCSGFEVCDDKRLRKKEVRFCLGVWV